MTDGVNEQSAYHAALDECSRWRDVDWWQTGLPDPDLGELGQRIIPLAPDLRIFIGSGDGEMYEATIQAERRDPTDGYEPPPWLATLTKNAVQADRRRIIERLLLIPDDSPVWRAEALRAIEEDG